MEATAAELLKLDDSKWKTSFGAELEAKTVFMLDSTANKSRSCDLGSSHFVPSCAIMGHCVVLCCGFYRCSFVDISSCQWRLMTVRKERDGNRSRSGVGWQFKCGWKRFLELSLLLGDERVDKIEMSKVSNFPYKASTGRLHQPRASSSGECENKVLAFKAQWDKETEVCV